MSGIFSNHNPVKLEINNKKKMKKITNMWKFNNMLLKNHWIKEEIKREIRNYLETMKRKIQHAKLMGCKKKNFKPVLREIYITKCLH